MHWFVFIVVFFNLWWLIFFMALPFGVKRVENPEPGQCTGAPARPYLLRKAGITTVIAGLLTALFFYFTGGIIIQPQ